jgi:hypothetical protein
MQNVIFLEQLASIRQQAFLDQAAHERAIRILAVARPRNRFSILLHTLRSILRPGSMVRESSVKPRAACASMSTGDSCCIA